MQCAILGQRCMLVTDRVCVSRLLVKQWKRLRYFDTQSDTGIYSPQMTTAGAGTEARMLLVPCHWLPLEALPRAPLLYRPWLGFGIIRQSSCPRCGGTFALFCNTRRSSR